MRQITDFGENCTFFPREGGPRIPRLMPRCQGQVSSAVWCGTWIVEHRFSDKPKVIIRHLGLSYASLLVL